MSLEEYKHLWDGSESGWKLHRVDHIEWSISLKFGEMGPTLGEIIALRKLVDELRAGSASEVMRELRGVDSYTLPSTLGNVKMQMFMEAAKKLDLQAEATSIDLGGYLPLSSDGSALLIEDEEVSAEVARRMLAAGIPVTEVHLD